MRAIGRQPGTGGEADLDGGGDDHEDRDWDRTVEEVSSEVVVDRGGRRG